MDLDELLDYCSALALAAKFEPTAESVWRKICRQYSKKFNTPLPQVMKMDPEEVALHVFEDNLEAFDPDEHIEHLLDLIYTLEDPEYVKQKEEELNEFIRDAERQEEQRVKEGRPIHPAMANDAAPRNLISKNEVKKESTIPTGGKVNLGHLQDDPNER